MKKRGGGEEEEEEEEEDRQMAEKARVFGHANFFFFARKHATVWCT